MEAKQNCDSNLLFCLDDMESDEDNEKEKRVNVVKQSLKKQRKFAERSQNLALFRRRQRQKSFLELEEDERQKLAATVLENDKFKNKSMFQYIKEKQLVTPSDYEEPDFISLEQPIDTEYEDNYSIEAPSIHDLFDFDIEKLQFQYEGNEEDYEMLEYIEEDEDL